MRFGAVSSRFLEIQAFRRYEISNVSLISIYHCWTVSLIQFPGQYGAAWEQAPVSCETAADTKPLNLAAAKAPRVSFGPAGEDPMMSETVFRDRPRHSDCRERKRRSGGGPDEQSTAPRSAERDAGRLSPALKTT